MKMFKRVLCFGLAMLLYVPMVNNSSAVDPQSSLRKNIYYSMIRTLEEENEPVEKDDKEIMLSLIDIMLEEIEGRIPRRLASLEGLSWEQQKKEMFKLARNHQLENILDAEDERTIEKIKSKTRSLSNLSNQEFKSKLIIYGKKEYRAMEKKRQKRSIIQKTGDAIVQVCRAYRSRHIVVFDIGFRDKIVLTGLLVCYFLLVMYI